MTSVRSVFLLLVAFGTCMAGGPLPTGLAQEGGVPVPFIIEDTAGDPFFLGDPPAAPPATAWSHIDIISLQAGPDGVSSFDFILTLGGRADPLTMLAEAPALSDVSCLIHWNYNGNADVTYSAILSTRDLLQAPGGDPPIMDPSLLRQSVDGDGRLTIESWRDGVDAVYDADLPGYLLEVKKQYARVMPDDVPPALGHTLTGLNAECRTDFAGVPIRDFAPNGAAPAGGSYAFFDPGPGDVVRIVFPDEEIDFDVPDGVPVPVIERRLGVAAGETTVLPFRLTNLDSARQSVTISAAAYDEQSNKLDWNVTVAKSVDLKPGENRTANVILRPPQGLQNGETGIVRIDIVTAGGDLGRASRDFIAVPVFTPENNRLRFHTAYNPTTDTPADPLVDRVRHPYRVTMSLLDTVADYVDAPVPIDPAAVHNYPFRLPPLVRPLLLEPEGLITLDLKIDGTGIAVVEFTLQDETAGPVFHYQGEVEAGKTTTISGLVLSDEPFLVGGGAELDGRLSLQLQVPGGVSADATFDPKGSGLTLPVMADAGLQRIITDGRYVPGVYLETGEIANVIINPGKTYAFALIVANDGAESDEITLSAEFGTPGWKHKFIPGERFRIEPGNTTAVGIEVIAPANIPENSKVPITVLASSKFDPVAVSRLALSATVQKGVDVQERRYTEREGALNPVIDLPKDSPGIEVLYATIALVALAAMVARRRR